MKFIRVAAPWLHSSVSVLLPLSAQAISTFLIQLYPWLFQTKKSEEKKTIQKNTLDSQLLELSYTIHMYVTKYIGCQVGGY